MSEECKICGEQVNYLPNHLRKHNLTITDYRKKYPPEWIYFTSALKKFNLSRNQLHRAIQQNLVESKEVKNPHYSSKTSTLVRVKDVSENREKIKQLPKYTRTEIEQREIYRERAKARNRLEFYCPRCKSNVRPSKGSLTFELAFDGEITPEEALENLKINYYRHIHTNYESELDNLNGEARDYCEVKNRYNEEARRLIQKDFSLRKMNEEQDVHAGRIKAENRTNLEMGIPKFAEHIRPKKGSD